MRHLVAVVAALVLAGPALADEPLSDPGREARARALMHEIACLVCEGQSIADSDAAVAADMRARVRADVEAGLSDTEIRDRMAAAYGEAALLRPSARGAGLVLWAAPILVLILGGLMAGLLLKPRRSTISTDASDGGAP